MHFFLVPRGEVGVESVPRGWDWGAWSVHGLVVCEELGMLSGSMGKPQVFLVVVFGVLDKILVLSCSLPLWVVLMHSCKE